MRKFINVMRENNLELSGLYSSRVDAENAAIEFINLYNSVIKTQGWNIRFLSVDSIKICEIDKPL